MHSRIVCVTEYPVLERLSQQDTPVKSRSLDLQAVTYIDMTGIYALQADQEERRDWRAEGVACASMGVHLPVMQVFKTSDFYKKLYPDLVIEIRGDAITVLFRRLDPSYCNDTFSYELFQECPLVE